MPPWSQDPPPFVDALFHRLTGIERRLADIDFRVADRRQLDAMLFRKIDALLNAGQITIQYLRYIAEANLGADQMSKLHDDLLAALTAANESASKVDTGVDQIIAVKTEGETQMQDVLTGMQNLQARFDDMARRLEEALGDNAATGGSTGGGSGAMQRSAPQPQTNATDVMHPRSGPETQRL
jgi:hypothetical protein